ncbi:unnamed protein product [Meloidogyne enterolobii]|uniref:Uncharacterized protein n=1 Tax=Meloidogyne enterolobii TaxID=390850 RepID=A0ACB0XQF7_MELEN
MRENRREWEVREQVKFERTTRQREGEGKNERKFGHNFRHGIGKAPAVFSPFLSFL